MVQLIRGLPAWFIAMHSLTIHHLLAPLIILAKDNYTAQRCTAERNVEQLSDHLNNNSGGGGEERVKQVCRGRPRHHRRVHVQVYAGDCMLLRSGKNIEDLIR